MELEQQRIKMAASDNILVIGPSWIGDMVMAQTLFKCLKQNESQCTLTVMASNWAMPLLARMPEVDASIDAQFGHGELKLGARRRIGRSLKPSNFTKSIILPNSFKSALIPFHAGIPSRIGWGGEWRYPLLTDCRRLDRRKFPLMAQRFAALAFPSNSQPPESIPYPRLQVDAIDVKEVLVDFGLEEHGKILAICPGAEYGEAKQWPSEHFAEVSNTLIAEGWQVWILGSTKDALVAEAIITEINTENHEFCVNLTGKTTLDQAIDLMSVTSVVVSNDSGLMHIASALRRPVVGLFGSTSPRFTPPLTERVKLLATDIECRPCFKRTCRYGHRRCLTELEPSLAIMAVHQLADE